MTFEDTIRLLLDGRAVTDIGQLSKATRGWLNRAAKVGLVYKDHDLTWPSIKTRYTALEIAALHKRFKSSRIAEDRARQHGH